MCRCLELWPRSISWESAQRFSSPLSFFCLIQTIFALFISLFCFLSSHPPSNFIILSLALSPTYFSSLLFSKIARLTLSPAGPHLLSCHPPLLQLSFLILLSIPSSSSFILFSSLATKSPLLLNHHVAPSSSHPANPVLFLSA